jgi:hypothetical protein
MMKKRNNSNSTPKLPGVCFLGSPCDPHLVQIISRFGMELNDSTSLAATLWGDGEDRVVDSTLLSGKRASSLLFLELWTLSIWVSSFRRLG